MSLYVDGEIAYAYMLNKTANAGLDEDKGLPTTIGEGYIAVDTAKFYISADGADWTHYITLTPV